MAALDDTDQLIEQFHPAQGEVVKGNPELVKKLLSRQEDVPLADPFLPPARGWEHVVPTMWSVLHRSLEMESSLAPRSWPAYRQ